MPCKRGSTFTKCCGNEVAYFWHLTITISYLISKMAKIATTGLISSAIPHGINQYLIWMSFFSPISYIFTYTDITVSHQAYSEFGLSKITYGIHLAIVTSEVLTFSIIIYHVIVEMNIWVKQLRNIYIEITNCRIIAPRILFYWLLILMACFTVVLSSALLRNCSHEDFDKGLLIFSIFAVFIGFGWIYPIQILMDGTAKATCTTAYFASWWSTIFGFIFLGIYICMITTNLSKCKMYFCCEEYVSSSEERIPSSEGSVSPEIIHSKDNTQKKSADKMNTDEETRAIEML